MTHTMDSRIAWRFLDFLKDILMHHRKFTPFQKLVFLTFLVGVVLGVLRNIWAVGIAVTYGLSIYSTVIVSGRMLAWRSYLASDMVLLFYSRVERVWKNFICDINVQEEQAKKEEESGSVSTKSDEHLIEDEFHDAIDKPPPHNRKMSLEPKQETLAETSTSTKVSQEIDIILHYIQRDFVQSWYTLFSSDEEALMEADVLLSNVFHDLKLRLAKLDRFEMAQIIMLMFSSHINKVRQAQMMLKAQRRRRRSSVKPTSSESTTSGQMKSATVFYKTVEECFGQIGAKSELHPAVRNKEMEQMYQKSVVEIILLNVFEENLTETKAVVCAMKEILMCNVLQSVLSLLSESSFLHERIIQITSDEELFKCQESRPSVLVTENDIVEKVMKPVLVSKAGASEKTSICNSSSKENLSQTTETLTDAPLEQKDKACSNISLTSSVEIKNSGTKWKEDVKTYTVSKAMCNECNRLCSADRDKISPRPHSCSLGTTPVFFDADRLSMDSFESFGSMSREGSPVFQIDVRDSQPPTPSLDNIPDIKVENTLHDNVFVDANESAKASEDQTECKQFNNTQEVEIASEPAEIENGNKNMSEMFFSMIPNPLNAFPILRKRSSSDLNVRNRSSPSLEQAEERSDSQNIRKSVSTDEFLRDQLSPSTPVDVFPWPSDAPSVFQDVRITGTETAKEPSGTSVYTLYIIEYEALYQSEEDLVHRTGCVKRRFREFVNLQSRLEDNTQYKLSLRDIKGPKKLIPSLPFGNMGKETLDNRKKMLEAFVVALIKRPEICKGEELKQFLGYSGDGHIAFVRKNPETSGRIDQRLVKTMSGVFDKIVEGFPSLPPQLPRIMTSSSRDDREDDCRPLVDLDRLELDFSSENDQHMYQRLDSALDRFMEVKLFDLVMGEEEQQAGDTTLGISVLGWQEKGSPGKGRPVSPVPQLLVSSPPSQATGKLLKPGHEIPSLDSEECPLISALLDILAELLSGQHSWFCRENVTHSTKVVLGKALDSYLQTKVAYLTSEPMTTFYLRIFRDTLWPGGQLSVEPRPTYTDGQKEILRKQAARCLGDFLPGVLRSLLGDEDFSCMIEEVFDTIQYEKLNRHFWYSVLDILLEKLFPEVNSTELQRKLSVTPEH